MRSQNHHGLGLRAPEGRVRPRNRPLPTVMVLGIGTIGCSPRNSTSDLLLQNMARHKSPDLQRSGTPCVLRLAFYLGTMLSVVLRIPGLRGGEFTPDTGATFCGGCSNQRDHGMRCVPPTYPGFGAGFWLIQLKMGMLRTGPRPHFFSKWWLRACQIHIQLYVSRLGSPDRAVVPRQQKAHPGIPSALNFLLHRLDKSLSTPYNMRQRTILSCEGADLQHRFPSSRRLGAATPEAFM